MHISSVNHILHVSLEKGTGWKGQEEIRMEGGGQEVKFMLLFTLLRSSPPCPQSHGIQYALDGAAPLTEMPVLLAALPGQV
jgi:hypothetical protein